MRVQELAKELNIPAQELIEKLEGLKIKISSRMTTLDSVTVDKIRKKFGKAAVKKFAAASAPKKKIKLEAKPTVKAAKKEKPAPKAVVTKKAAAKPQKPKEKPLEAAAPVVSKPSVTRPPLAAVAPKAPPVPPVFQRKPSGAPPSILVSRPKPVEKPRPQAATAPEKKPAVVFPQEAKPQPPKPQPQQPQPAKPVEVPAAVPAPAVSVPAAPTGKEIQLKLPITVKDLALKLQEKVNVVIKRLMDLGVFATINQSLGEDVVEKLLVSFGCVLKRLPTDEETLLELHSQEEDAANLKPRPPVVTFMGHVDHGKTSLLDYIRKSKITEHEHGGITQHIGAYKVALPKGSITFLDTPGHEAFTAMRARGANTTDIVVLVVAADEGVMPQTIEAIDHAKAAKVPIVVALNKIDRPQAEPDRVKKQLAELDLAPEDWGGKTIVVGVSAKTGEGVDTLLEMMLLEAELLELKANYERPASGIVVEAKLTKGKGPLATVIVQNGTLRRGEVIIAGSCYGVIRALFDDHERPIQLAGPAMPVEVLGLSGVPQAGEPFYVVEDEKKARDISQKRQAIEKQKQMVKTARVSLQDLHDRIQEGEIKELNIVLKVDVQGSLEALRDSLVKLSAQEVKLVVIHGGIGAINTSDVVLALASNAIIIGFNIDVIPQAKEQADKEGIDIHIYRIIYEAINEMKAALEGMLEPQIIKKFMGRVEIRQVFRLSRSGVIAGCFVQKGKITRNANVDLVRNGQKVYEGKIGSLKRFKDDVREVAEGFECGIALSNHDDILAGDIIEAHELEKVLRKL